MKKWKLRKIDEKNIHIWIGIVALFAIFLIGGFLFLNRPSQLDRLDADYLNVIDQKTVKKNTQSSFDHVYTLQDYTVYGETLNLYHKKYDGMKKDDTLGKIIVLENIDTHDEHQFTITGGIDSGIPLGELNEGLYRVSIYDQYIKKRLCFEEEMHSEVFTTLRRVGKVKNIRLDAAKHLFKNVELDRNYLFLSVVESIPKVKVNDVIINAQGNTYNSAINGVDVGATSSLASEPVETLELAKLIQSKLESAGLKVELARKDQNAMSYYGQSGRVSLGYESQAKVYLNLAMIEDEEVRRPYIKTSPHTSAYLANQIAYTMRQGNMELSDMVNSSILDHGVVYDDVFYEEDERTVYSVQPGIRETGGKGTYAGRLDFAKENGKYKKSYGMESVIVYVASVANEDSVKYYKENVDAFATQIANGILTYYGMGGVVSETTAK